MVAGSRILGVFRYSKNPFLVLFLGPIMFQALQTLYVLIILTTIYEYLLIARHCSVIKQDIEISIKLTSYKGSIILYFYSEGNCGSQIFTNLSEVIS